MLSSATSVILCRVASVAIILLAAMSLEVGSFPYRSVFVGLLFSHFLLGFYYSKRNASALLKKKTAWILATGILAAGLYFSFNAPYVAPYFLVVHSALSDAYLLPIKARPERVEKLKLLKVGFYTVGFGLLFIGPALATPAIVATMVGLGLAMFLAIWIYTEERLTLGLFELPLVAFVAFSITTSTTFDIHFLGFYHILTWYAFSFWMLFIKEKNTKKTVSFFSMVAALSAAFILLFEMVVKAPVTDLGFARIIAFWSIMHITSTIPLSKLNPAFIKKIFYSADGVGSN